MRCLSCDVALTDQEATRKYTQCKEFVDLCNKCYSTIQDDINVTISPEQDDEAVC